MVEDDPHVSELLRVCVELEGHELRSAGNGEEALRLVHQQHFDLILLDLMLPLVDGREVCRQLRQVYHYENPILMVTAKSSELDKVNGLDLGADDYITKPFSPRELQARIRAHLRRGQSQADDDSAPAPLEFAGLVIDPSGYRADVFGETAKLTRKEFALLHCLAAHPGQILTRDQLLDLVWGYAAGVNTRTVDEHVRRLRQKLQEAGSAYSYVQTVWGIGYKFEVGTP